MQNRIFYIAVFHRVLLPNAQPSICSRQRRLGSGDINTFFFGKTFLRPLFSGFCSCKINFGTFFSSRSNDTDYIVGDFNKTTGYNQLFGTGCRFISNYTRL